MRLVLQRVREASVTVDDKCVAKISKGLLTLVGLAHADTEETLKKALSKAVELRIFEDEQGKMNRSLKDINGEQLLVSQFTLCADCSTGRRPSFTGAMPPQEAEKLFLRAQTISESFGIKSATGVFQADMKVSLVNDGPVTIVLDF